MSTDAVISSPAPLPARDFADWLSPMIVKELRQGLRANAFVAVFLILQVLMIFSMLLMVANSNYDAENFSASNYDGLFWGVMGILLLFVMPLRALGAISGELKMNTLELIHLTRLSSSKILFGKWSSLMLQSLLLVAAVLPYFVLRYFFGGVDIVNDLRAFGLMLLLSGVVTAFMLALSTAPVAIRILFLVPLGLPAIGITQIIIQLIFTPYMRAGFFGGVALSSGSAFYALFAFYAACYTMLLLEIGATRIAPEAENHAWRKRLIALLLLAPALIALFAMSPTPDTIFPLIAIAAPVLLYVIAESLCESVPEIPPIFRPYAKRGPAGWLAAFVFAPGWLSGVLFTLLAFGAFFGAVYAVALQQSSTQWLEFKIAFYSLFLGLFFPLIFLRTFFRRAKQPLLFYLLIQLFCGIIATFCTIIASYSKDVTASFFVASFPASTFFFSLVQAKEAKANAAVLLMGNSIVLLVTLAVLARPAIRDFRKMLALLKTSTTPK
jgi:hypothetical protein